MLVDGKHVRSCLMLALQARRRAITIIEGLRGPHGELDRVQEAFVKHGALPCSCDMETFYNVIRCDNTHMNVGGFAALMQAQGGKAVTVFPAKYAEAKPVYPMPTWEKRERKK